jgi:DNA-binding transcriptional MerR regulator
MDKILYTTPVIVQMYNIAPQTVRNWATEFADYLSHTANPGEGRTRQFTTEDMTVIDMIVTLKKNGQTFEDIHAALANGQRGSSPDLSPSEINALIESGEEKSRLMQIAMLEMELDRTRQERDTVVALNQTQTAELNELRLRVARLEAQLSTFQEQFEGRLLDAKERGRLEGELQFLREQMRKTSGDSSS